MLHSPVRKVLGPNLTRDKRHSVIARDRGRANSCEQQIHIFQSCQRNFAAVFASLLGRVLESTYKDTNRPLNMVSPPEIATLVLEDLVWLTKI